MYCAILLEGCQHVLSSPFEEIIGDFPDIFILVIKNLTPLYQKTYFGIILVLFTFTEVYL